MMLTTQERAVIQKARDLIADPGRWCQGRLALTNEGNPAWPYDPAAVRFCARGALMHVTGTVFWDATCALSDAKLNETAARLFPDLVTFDEWGVRDDAIVGVNNNLGHDAVLAVFDKVLADESVA